MPIEVNTASLQSTTELGEANSTEKAMVKINDVSMVFNMANEQLNSLKEYAIALMRHELRFKEFRALDHISFEVKKGDVYGILGTNGSGKSTLLKIIAGVLEPSEGSVSIQGNIAPLIELGAGFDLELTARENIFLNGALLGYSKKFIEENFDSIVDFAEINNFLDMPMKNYSSGMVARIAFSIATVIVPDILIVDEVLSVGDFMFQQKCERRISELIRDHDVTVLIVSHSNDQIERLCNKAIWIEKGHMRMMGDAHSVCRTYRALGGHTGSAESERVVFDMLKRTESPSLDFIKLFAADDRYGMAVKLSESSDIQPSKTAVVALGEDDATCLVGSCLSSALGASFVLTKATSLPDITAHYLKQIQPDEIFVVDKSHRISPEVCSEIQSFAKSGDITRISENTSHDLALAAYRCLDPSAWGQEAIVTWDCCTGDIISLLPHTYKSKAPLFFEEGGGALGETLSSIISSRAFKKIFVLASNQAEGLPDSLFAKAVDLGSEIIRFEGADPYEANAAINKWAEENRLDRAPVDIIIAPAWRPANSFALGQIAATRNALLLYEDPDNLDSVASAIQFIQSKADAINQIIFIGSRSIFSEIDVSIIAKAIVGKA